MKRPLLRRCLAAALLLACGGCQFLQNELFYLDRVPPPDPPASEQRVP